MLQASERATVTDLIEATGHHCHLVAHRFQSPHKLRCPGRETDDLREIKISEAPQAPQAADGRAVQCSAVQRSLSVSTNLEGKADTGITH